MMIVQCERCGACHRFGGPPFDVEAIGWKTQGEQLVCMGCIQDERRRRLDIVKGEGWRDRDDVPDTLRNVIVALRENGARITTIGFYTAAHGWYAVADDLKDRIKVKIDWWRELPPHPEAGK